MKKLIKILQICIFNIDKFKKWMIILIFKIYKNIINIKKISMETILKKNLH